MAVVRLTVALVCAGCTADAVLLQYAWDPLDQCRYAREDVRPFSRWRDDVIEQGTVAHFRGWDVCLEDLVLLRDDGLCVSVAMVTMERPGETSYHCIDRPPDDRGFIQERALDGPDPCFLDLSDDAPTCSFLVGG